MYWFFASALPAVEKGRGFRAERGDIRLQWIQFGAFCFFSPVGVDILKIQSRLKAALISSLRPRLLIFLLSPCKEMHSSQGETTKLWSLRLHSFLFYKSTATTSPTPTPPTLRTSTGSLKGLSCSVSAERKGQASGCSMKIQQAWVSSGPNKGHRLCEGAPPDCFANKLAVFSPGSGFTCIRGWDMWGWGNGTFGMPQCQIIVRDARGGASESFIRGQTQSRYICP